MPWSPDPFDTTGYWFTGLYHPTTGSYRDTTLSQSFGHSTALCPWSSTLFDLTGFTECSVGVFVSSVTLAATPDTPTLPADYYTVYLNAPDETPIMWFRDPTNACDPDLYNPIAQTIGGCRTDQMQPTLTASTLGGDTVMSDGTHTPASHDWSGAESSTPPTSAGTPGWVVNPTPITGDPNIDSSDPATVLLWTPAQLAATAFGFNLSGEVFGGAFRFNISVFPWRLITPVPPAENVAMIV